MFRMKARNVVTDRDELLRHNAGDRAAGEGRGRDSMTDGSAESESRRKMARLQDKISEVRGVVVDSIDKVLVRGEKLSEMEAVSAELAATAHQFRAQTGKVKRHMFWRNVKHWAYVAGAVIVVVGVIALVIAL